MKKTTYILLLTLLVGFVSNVSAQTSPKIRFIDLQYVAQQLPAFKKAQKELTDLKKQLETELLKKQGELKTKFAAYEKEAPTMSGLIRASREQELKRLQDELVKFDRTARQQSMVKEQQLLSPIYKSISKNVEAYSAEKQIDFVLRKDQLVYDTKGFNISDDILRKMGITPKKVTSTGSNNKK